MKSTNLTSSGINDLDGQKILIALEEMESLDYHQRRLLLRELVNLGGVGDPNIDIPPWLIDGCDFGSKIWKCAFGARHDSHQKEVNFEILLSDGSLLTDEKNEKVLRFIKLFLCVQLHPRYNAGARVSADTESRMFVMALQFIDSLLLDDDELNLGRNGFALLTLEKIESYLIYRTGTPSAEVVYDYKRKLTIWLKKISNEISELEYEQSIAAWPEIIKIIPEKDRELELADYELLRARAYFKLHGIVWKGPRGEKFNSACYIKEAYRNTLHGMSIVPVRIQELDFSKVEPTEFSRVPVKREDESGVTLQMLASHAKMVKHLGVVAANYDCEGLNIDGINDIEPSALFEEAVKKYSARYLSLPSAVVFDAIGASFSFAIENAAVIFDSILRVVIKLKKTNTLYRRGKRAALEIEQANHFDLNKLGVSEWYYHESSSSSSESTNKDRIRSAPTLVEIYNVLIGAILIVLGCLTARRQAEIRDLDYLDCLSPMTNPNFEKNKNIAYRMVYWAAKTGSRQSRLRFHIGITLPMAKLLWKLIEFHRKLKRLGLMGEAPRLLVGISPRGPKYIYKFGTDRYNKCLDLACDYFQTKVIQFPDGIHRRYYIRQHQLRRFFAMVFFWGSSFDGLDVLVYALGHSDPEHLFHYLSESYSGKVFRSIKAEKICDSLTLGKSDIEGLEKVKLLLLEKFGASDFIISTPEEIQNDYGRLIRSGAVVPDITVVDWKAQNDLFGKVLFLCETKVIDINARFFDFTEPDGHVSRRYQLFMEMSEQE